MLALEQLYGQNAGTIMAAVIDTVKRESPELWRGVVAQYRVDAMSGDYAHLIQVSRDVLKDFCDIDTYPYDPTVTANGIPKEWLKGDDD